MERELGIDAGGEKSHRFEQKWVFMPGALSKQVCVYTGQKPRASLKTWLSEPTWVRTQHTGGGGLWSHQWKAVSWGSVFPRAVSVNVYKVKRCKVLRGSPFRGKGRDCLSMVPGPAAPGSTLGMGVLGLALEPPCSETLGGGSHSVC